MTYEVRTANELYFNFSLPTSIPPDAKDGGNLADLAMPKTRINLQSQHQQKSFAQSHIPSCKPEQVAHVKEMKMGGKRKTTDNDKQLGRTKATPISCCLRSSVRSFVPLCLRSADLRGEVMTLFPDDDDDVQTCIDLVSC